MTDPKQTSSIPPKALEDLKKAAADADTVSRELRYAARRSRMQSQTRLAAINPQALVEQMPPDWVADAQTEVTALPKRKEDDDVGEDQE